MIKDTTIVWWLFGFFDEELRAQVARLISTSLEDLCSWIGVSSGSSLIVVVRSTRSSRSIILTSVSRRGGVGSHVSGAVSSSGHICGLVSHFEMFLSCWFSEYGDSDVILFLLYAKISRSGAKISEKKMKLRHFFLLRSLFNFLLVSIFPRSSEFRR